MKRFAKFFGGLGLISFCFGLLAGLIALQSGGQFLTTALIQLGIGVLGVGIFAFYFIGDALRAILQKREAIFGAVGGLLLLALLIGLNVVAHSKFGERKWDLTTNRVHSLSADSDLVLKGLSEKIRIYAFYEQGNRRTDVLKNLFEKYDYVTDNLSLEIVDPNEEPVLLKRFGAQVGEVVLARGEGKTEKNLKILTNRESPTEENLTNGIKRILKDTEKTIYFLQGSGQSSLDNPEDPKGIYLAKSKLGSEGFRVQSLNLVQTQSIPKDAAIVVSWGASRPVSEMETKALSAYLAKGGSVVIAQDPLISANNDRLIPTGFENLLATYRMSLKQALSIEILAYGGRETPSATILAYNYGEHPMIAALRDPKELKITQFGLALPVVTIAGKEKDSAGEKIKVSPLILTTERAWGETNIRDMLRGEGGRATKSSQEGDISGPFSIAQIAEWKVEKPEATDWSPDGRLVVFGSAGFGTDALFNAQYNRDLFLNTFNFLSGDKTASLSIRPKTWTQSTLKMDEGDRRFVIYASLFMLPQIILILSLFVWIMRRGQV